MLRRIKSAYSKCRKKVNSSENDEQDMFSPKTQISNGETSSKEYSPAVPKTRTMLEQGLFAVGGSPSCNQCEWHMD